MLDAEIKNFGTGEVKNSDKNFDIKRLDAEIKNFGSGVCRRS